MTRLTRMPRLTPMTRTLGNGVRLLALPSVSRVSSCQIVGRGGVLYRPRQPGQAGACSLMARTFPTAFAPFCDHHLFGLSLTATADDLASGLDSLIDALLEPRYTERQLEAIRAKRLASLRQPMTWEDRALRALRCVLFGHQHPYSRSELGTSDALRGLTLADVDACHRELCVGSNLVVAVSGRAATESLMARLSERLATIAEGTPPLAVDAAPGVKTRVITNTHVDAGSVGWLALGFSGIRWDAREWVALELAKTLLVGPGPNGALASGSLVERLRAEGLAYSVQCLHHPGFGDGLFALLAAFGHHRGERLIELVDAELAALRSGNFADATAAASGALAFARKVYRLTHTMLYEEPRRQAFFAARQALLSGDPDAWMRIPAQVASTTVEDIAEVCSRLLVDARQAIIRAEPPGSANAAAAATVEL